MKLEKYEQSGFILETKNGFKLAFDIAKMTPIEKLKNITVDAMIVSHIHGDHFSPEHIATLKPKTVLLPRECLNVVKPNSLKMPSGASAAYAITHPEISAHFIVMEPSFIFDNGEVQVGFFHVDHGPNTSGPVENFGFLIHADGETVYFAGDMFYPSGIDVSNLSVDYALIPVGTHYTFGPNEAHVFAKTFKKIGKIIPMHFEKKPETESQFYELIK